MRRQNSARNSPREGREGTYPGHHYYQPVPDLVSLLLYRRSGLQDPRYAGPSGHALDNRMLVKLVVIGLLLNSLGGLDPEVEWQRDGELSQRGRARAAG